MKNKLEIAFWIFLFLVITTGAVGLYLIIDHTVSVSNIKEEYSDTEADLESIIQIIGQTNQGKQEIKKSLENHRLFGLMDFRTDTVKLERVILVFEDDLLKQIEKQW